MPKTPKKTAKTIKKKVAAVKAKKAAPKLKLKSTAKPQAEAKGSRRGFMWKVLEHKQQKQKEQSGSMLNSANPQDRAHGHANQHGYGRFNGPRRRVG